MYTPTVAFFSYGYNHINPTCKGYICSVPPLSRYRPIFLLKISRLYLNGNFSNLPYRWLTLESLYLPIMRWPDLSIDNQLNNSHSLDLPPLLLCWLIIVNCMGLHASRYPFTVLMILFHRIWCCKLLLLQSSSQKWIRLHALQLKILFILILLTFLLQSYLELWQNLGFPLKTVRCSPLTVSFNFPASYIWLRDNLAKSAFQNHSETVITILKIYFCNIYYTS